MARNTENVWEFHLKMDSAMKNSLQALNVFSGTDHISGIIVCILQFLSNRIENEHLSHIQRASHYEYIHPDIHSERESVHVYMTEHLYKKLKLMHHDLNFYSIAQLVREFLRIFLELSKKYGDSLKSIIRDFINKSQNKGNIKKFTGSKQRQLSKFIEKNQEKIQWLNIYDQLYCPIKMYRC